MVVGVRPAHGSALLVDVDVKFPTLAVNAKGEALVTYTRTDGRPRRVLAWDAINALPPVKGVPQTKFRLDYAGGWGKYRRLYWKTFKNTCRPYDGPPLSYFVAGCKAADGSYWALQSWQRNLPHRGWPPWTAAQKAFEVHLSHWTGELANLELYTDWAFDGDAHDIFGRMTYAGEPVHGFGTTSSGNPTDSYGRSLYIDTFDSAYGPGWKRETSIVFHNPTGAFCYSFWPTHDVSLPGQPARPAGNGKRYRISVIGPGVTPDVVAEADDKGPYEPAVERKMDALFTDVIAGDKFCATQH